MAEQNHTEERTIEEMLSQLEQIIRTLEDGEISLEDSFEYYETGMKLVRECSGRIDRVEKKIRVLNEPDPVEENR